MRKKSICVNWTFLLLKMEQKIRFTTIYFNKICSNLFLCIINLKLWKKFKVLKIFLELKVFLPCKKRQQFLKLLKNFLTTSTFNKNCFYFFKNSYSARCIKMWWANHADAKFFTLSEFMTGILNRFLTSQYTLLDHATKQTVMNWRMWFTTIKDSIHVVCDCFSATSSFSFRNHVILFTFDYDA
jgi:hypothetical protein